VPRLKAFRWDAWVDDAADEILWLTKGGTEDIPLAIDTETTGVGFYDEPFAATITWRRNDGSLKSAYVDLEGDGRERRIEMLGGILRMTSLWVFHNSKFDLQKLLLVGAITPEMLQEVELHDTQTLYTLLDENGRKGLKHLAATVLKVDDTIEVEIKSGPNKGQTKRVPKEEHRLAAVRRKLKLKKEDGYHLLPRDVLIPYALRDTEFTLLLWEKLMPQLEAVGDPRLLELYREFMELKLVLLDMEADGFELDLPYLDCVTSEYGVKVMEGWDRIVQLTGKPELNPQSPAQIIEAFEGRGVLLESTAEAALKDVDDELAEALLQYRSDKKIHTTYLKALQSEHRDGRVHPNFNDDAARTGRMSSSSASNN
jgi:DNA polymerase I-like protein with 3'-5' exonuclease and polymerase domains